MVTDPIADFLTRVRNAQMAGHRIVEIPASNLKKRITEILYDQGSIPSPKNLPSAPSKELAVLVFASMQALPNSRE